MQLLVYRTDGRRHIRLTFRSHDAQQFRRPALTSMGSLNVACNLRRRLGRSGSRSAGQVSPDLLMLLNADGKHFERLGKVDSETSHASSPSPPYLISRSCRGPE